MMDAEAVANRSSYWKLAAALQSFLLLLQKKRLGKENEPGGISISPRSSLEPTRKTASVFLGICDKSAAAQWADVYRQAADPHP